MIENLDKFRFREKIAMRWSDLDEMRHVNNAVYLTYFEQGRLNYFGQAIGWEWENAGIIQARAIIDYVMPLYLTDEPYLYIRCARIGNKSLELEHLIIDEKTTPRLIAKGMVVLVTFDYKTQQSIPVPDSEREKFAHYEKAMLS